MDVAIRVESKDGSRSASTKQSSIAAQKWNKTQILQI